MKHRRPSLTLLAGLMLLILALVVVFFHGGAATDSSETSDIQQRSNKRFGSAPMARESSKGARPERVGRIEKLISEQFSEEREIEFYNGPGDLSEVYREKGLRDFYGEMRNALRRDESAIAEIFTTYLAEPESYGGFINILIENLGDGYFFSQIQRQPERTQSLILGQIWQTISRSPLDYRGDGSIPVADSGIYYPKCGELFLALLEKELKSDYWQRQKKIKSEQAGGNGGQAR